MLNVENSVNIILSDDDSIGSFHLHILRESVFAHFGEWQAIREDGDAHWWVMECRRLTGQVSGRTHWCLLVGSLFQSREFQV